MFGPFEPSIDYLGNDERIMNPGDIYEIIIQDTDIYKYKYLRFMFKQDLHRKHNQTIQAYLVYGDTWKRLPMKPSPSQVFEFIEYRVRLSETELSGLDIIKLVFLYNHTGNAHLYLKELMFGSYDEDIILHTGVTIGTGPGGITSPIMGYVPMAINEVMDVKLYPFTGYKLDRVEIYGEIYNENGEIYNSIIYDEHFKVKYTTPFENSQIIAYFRSR